MARLRSIRRNRSLAATLPKDHMFSSERELTYREFEQTVESETGALDRKKKNSTETEKAA